MRMMGALRLSVPASDVGYVCILGNEKTAPSAKNIFMIEFESAAAG
jgi:hypothetical protein